MNMVYNDMRPPNVCVIVSFVPASGFSMFFFRVANGIAQTNPRRDCFHANFLVAYASQVVDLGNCDSNYS